MDAVTYATGREGVFAGGDLQTGPWVAIGAIAAGREAAESIVRYLDGRDMAAGREPIAKDDPVYRPIPVGAPQEARAKMPELAAGQRKGNFKEVELGYDEDSGPRGSAPLPQLRVLLRVLPVCGGLRAGSGYPGNPCPATRNSEAWTSAPLFWRPALNRSIRPRLTIMTMPTTPM